MIDRDRLPSHSDYSQALARTAEKHPISSEQQLAHLLGAKAARSHAFGAHMQTAAKLGFMLEPFDRATEGAIDSTWPTSRSFQLGYGYGLLSAGSLMGEDAAKDIPAYASQLPKQDEEDELQIKHELASTVVAIGEEGLGFVGQRAVDELERIEMLVVRDATKQRFFRIGAGAVFYAAQHYLAEQLEHEQARQLELLQQQYDSLRTDNSDWDMALQDLLGT